MGPNKGVNSEQNRIVKGIADKYDLTLKEYYRLRREVHQAKGNAAYDLDINGNLHRAHIEEMAEDILRDRER